jgi:hypothetical protein
MWTIAKHGRHDIVAVGEDVRGDVDTLADRTLDGDAAAVNLGPHMLDNHATRMCGSR